MRRKYIDRLGIKFEDTPQGYFPGDVREDIWVKQRKEYGFDERETWSLDYSLKLWLYERLKMYDEIKIIDATRRKYIYNNKKITLQDCIDRMIEGLELDLKLDEYDSRRSNKRIKRKINNVFDILALCINDLWW